MFTSQQTRATSTTLSRIVESTRRLLAEEGLAALSMRAVAAQSGITVGAIYRHFPNKKLLVDQVVADTLRGFEMWQLEAITPLPVGSLERVVALGEAYIRVAIEHQEHFKILFTHQRRTPRKLADLPGHGGYRILRQCVVEAMKSGAMRRADPDLASFFLWSRVHGIVLLLMACEFQGTLPVEPDRLNALGLFDLTRDFVIDGLRPSGTGPTPEPEELR